MPNLYARQTALTNVGGRIDYISNPKRQEHLLAVFDGAADLVAGAYWRQLALECKAASKHATPEHKCVQGRELVIQLSNSLLQRKTPEQIAEELARSFEKKYGRPCMVAIHFNKNKTNLHAHLIYSERELLPDLVTKVAERNLFFDAQGKRRYKKSEILDENKQLLPGCRIVKKGEVYERRHFSSVDPTFSSKEWLRRAKKEWLLPLRNGELKGDVEITEYDPSSGKLPQQHIGNKASDEIAERIRKYNEDVRAFNRIVDQRLIALDDALDMKQRVDRAPLKHPVLQNLLARMRQAIRAAEEQLRKRQERKKGLDDQISGAQKKAQEALGRPQEKKKEESHGSGGGPGVR